jgi:hypothetical protein
MIASHPADADIEKAAGYFRQTRGCEVLDRRWRAPDGGGEAHILAAVGQHVLYVGVIRHHAPGSRRFLGKKDVERFRRIGLAWMDAHGARYDRVEVEVVTIARDVIGETEAG